MRLDKLHAQQFRNLAEVTLVPDARLTVLCGRNGQGKTNLLEAVWLLTGGKSFRAGRDAELIRRGQDFAVLEADFTAQQRAQTLRLTVAGRDSARPGRMARLNGVDCGRAAAVAGRFTAVVFEPDHLRLVKDGPAGRRRFLDAALCQCWPAHVGQLRRYHRTLAQKNALLRAWRGSEEDKLLLETFNAALAEAGGAVMARRAAFVAALAPLAAANYAELSRGAEVLAVRYRPCAPPPDGAPDGTALDTLAAQEGIWAAALAARLQRVRGQELAAGCSLAGPHREDMEILLDGQPGRVYGSQGQQRSAVLAIKLAEADVLGALLDDTPVVLLDDVLSELDEERQAYLLRRIGGKQTIVTTCDSTAFGRTDGKLVFVESGTVRENL